MNPVPELMLADEQEFEQLGIPGAWSQGVDSLVPLFVSAPLAAMK
jgi:hypothetical protein